MRELDTNDIIETAELLYNLGVTQTYAEGRMLVHKKSVKVNGEPVNPIMRKPKSGDILTVGKNYAHLF